MQSVERAFDVLEIMPPPAAPLTQPTRRVVGASGAHHLPVGQNAGQLRLRTPIADAAIFVGTQADPARRKRHPPTRCVVTSAPDRSGQGYRGNSEHGNAR